MASTSKLHRNGAVGFIDWLDLSWRDKRWGIDTEAHDLQLVAMFTNRERHKEKSKAQYKTDRLLSLSGSSRDYAAQM